MELRGGVFLLSVFMLAGVVSAETQPNIVFILADDLGWDDVSFHGSKQIPTPNIDTLAYDGIILNNYYVQPICTPSRSALMTGKHPIHTGMQLEVIMLGQPYGLALDEKILPDYFRDIGYATHAVGKWHLGSCSWNYTPTYRGFDSHYGYFQGKEDYWDHTDGTKGRTNWGLDFWDGTDVVRTAYGQYSTELFATRAEKIISEHDTAKPLFLYLPYQSIHSGNPVTPLEADWKYLKNFDYIEEEHRRKVAGMVSALDDAVGNVTKALAARGMLSNSVIVFSTDNGGPAAGYDMNMACNWPLRGMKRGLWEGGVRGNGFLWSPLLQKTGYVSNHMMQVFDWLPTLLSVAGYDMTQLPDSIDGMDFWDTLSKNNVKSPRTEMLHNIDHKYLWSLRVGNMKLIYGKNGMSGWYAPGQKASHADLAELDKDDPDVYWDEMMAMVDEAENTPPEKYLEARQMETAPDWMFHSDLRDVLKSIRRDVNVDPHPVVVDCGPKPENASTNCNVTEKPCLYNITADPCEYFNLAASMPDVVTSLLARLAVYNATAVPPRNKPADPAASPVYHQGTWAPWLNGTCDKSSHGYPDVVLI